MDNVKRRIYKIVYNMIMKLMNHIKYVNNVNKIINGKINNVYWEMLKIVNFIIMINV